MLITEQHEFLLDVANLIQYAAGKGYTVTGGELYRTLAQQKIYVEQGKSKTMDSNHLRRLAIDLNFFWQGEAVTDYDLEDFGRYWESLNKQNRWGGNFHDLPDRDHFERNVV